MKREPRKLSRETADAGTPSDSISHPLGWFILLFLVTILCVRMTMTEALRQTLSAKFAALEMLASPDPLPTALEVGPAAITGLFTLTLACAAGACAIGRAALTRTRLLQAGLIAGIALLGIASTFHAANRFAALVGLADVLMALVGGWTLSLLCAPALLGSAGRRFVLAALIAILAAWCAKGLVQRFDEIPAFQEFYQHNKEAVWMQQGLRAGEPGVALFEGRINSGEVGTFVTLANVAAAGFIGLISVLVGLLVAVIVDKRPDAPANRLPGIIAGLVALACLAAVSVLVLTMTLSKGGTAAAALCVVAIIAGTVLRKHVVRWRRQLLLLTLGAALLGAAGVVTYGIQHDALPTKSLLFRWHYWTATMPIIRESPVLGVGLNNFGDYYGQFKRPSSPEDVKDPHSMFVRLAAELGIPAMLLMAAMIFVTVRAATRGTATTTQQSNRVLSTRQILALAGVMLAVVWVAHFFMAEPPQAWFFYMTMFYAIAAMLAFFAADLLLSHLSEQALQIVLVAALVGGMGMLLYDQVNMALVAGPVAMLFWALLGLAGSVDAPPSEPVATNASSPNILLHGPSVVFSAGALVSAILWFSIADGSFSWDPAPHEWASVQALRAGKFADSLAAIDQAMLRTPRSQELLRRRLQLRVTMHQNVGDDIRRILDLDRANARPRMELGLLESDLPAKERIDILNEGIMLDAALPKDEPKKLTAADHERIDAAIKELAKRP